MVGVNFPVPIPTDCPFGIHNIPFGIISTAPGVGLGSKPRAAIAIGDYALELHELAKRGLFGAHSRGVSTLEEVFLEAALNSFASFSGQERRRIRATVIEALSDPKSLLFTNRELNENAFVSIKDVQMHLPMKITDYTDSFSSLIHAQNCLHPLGLELPAAFVEYPMGYNGRLSSIKLSGTQVLRPCGFYPSEGDTRPTFQPTKQLDFEIELGAFVSKPVEFGTSIAAKAAADHIFGYVLHNDWSARDIQKYEMPPLGPLHSKGFVTTISPWVVTIEALEGSKCRPPASCSTKIHPSLVPDELNHGTYDIAFSATVRRGGDKPVEIIRSNFSDSYWSVPQMIAYQSSAGHGINTGDLIASGTISSPPPSAKVGLGTYGCLLEVFAQNHKLPEVGGEPMSWLEDGDEFTIDGWFNTTDGSRAGFGGVTSLVLPAKSSWP